MNRPSPPSTLYKKKIPGLSKESNVESPRKLLGAGRAVLLLAPRFSTSRAEAVLLVASRLSAARADAALGRGWHPRMNRLLDLRIIDVYPGQGAKEVSHKLWVVEELRVELSGV